MFLPRNKFLYFDCLKLKNQFQKLIFCLFILLFFKFDNVFAFYKKNTELTLTHLRISISVRGSNLFLYFNPFILK